MTKRATLAAIATLCILACNPAAKEKASSLSPTAPDISALTVTGDQGNAVELGEASEADTETMRADIAAKFGNIRMAEGVVYKDGVAITPDKSLAVRSAVSAIKAPHVVRGGKVTVYDRGPRKVDVAPDSWTTPIKSFAFRGNGAASDAKMTGLTVMVGRRNTDCFNAHVDFQGMMVMFWYNDNGLFGYAASPEQGFDFTWLPPEFRPRVSRMITLTIEHATPGPFRVLGQCGGGIRIPAANINFEGSDGDSYVAEGPDLYSWVRFLD